MSQRVVSEGDLLWSPSEQRSASSRMQGYMDWLAARRGLAFDDYHALHAWSVQDPDAFWRSLADHFEVRLTTPSDGGVALADAKMPGSAWFPGATVNHAEHLLRHAEEHAQDLCVIARNESGEERRMTYGGLRALTARARVGLLRLGVGRGDRVAAFASNLPETLAAFLATASLGAIWSSCAPEFGVSTVLDRFQQIEPKVLFAVGGYRYGGKDFDRTGALAEIVAGLPTLKAVVRLDTPGWSSFLGPEGGPALTFDELPFNHPLWVLYSSGTTGLPKAIVQGHGGILLEHLKAISLHSDLGRGDRFFWYTTTGWMMWNYLIGGLLVGATIVLWDGHPMYPGQDALWAMASVTKTTFFGGSAPYFMACRKAGMTPGRSHDLSRLRGVGSTGAPLPVEGFAWVYEAVGEDLQLASVSGGTDVCTAFLLGSPTLPVHAGELQCAGLGCGVSAYDPDSASPIDDAVGELVLTSPLPSMPTGFWGDDADQSRLRSAYFEMYPGVWRHGDWVKRVSARNSYVVYGRSDSTLNRGGVRMGTSEFYRVVETLPAIADSLVVDTGGLGKEGRLWLFVQPASPEGLSEAQTAQLRRTLRTEVSPRHVPDEIVAVPEIPYTLSGKKIEVPIKRILTGDAPPDKAVSADSLRNPGALRAFLELLSP